jgi:uncharacterized protein
MPNVAIPTDEESYGLLRKYGTPEHIIQHSQRVWEVGRLLGAELVRRQYPINLSLLKASCLLHDIGKYPCILDGTRHHDVRGEQILLEEGFPEVARIIVQHVLLRVGPEAPVREEHVLYYSDKRVVHDEVVSLEDRFVYLLHTYAKNPESERGIMRMKEETLRIERDIFLFLDFNPDDLVDRLGT